MNKRNKKRRRLTGNKGQWSELIVHFFLLIVGKIFFGDVSHHHIKIPHKHYKIVGIERVEGKNERVLVYIRKGLDVLVYLNDTLFNTIPISRIKEYHTNLIQKLTKKYHSSRSLSFRNIEKFMNEMGSYVLILKPRGKTDITLLVEIEGFSEPLRISYSIKSFTGASAKLLGAYKALTFRVWIDGLSDQQIAEIEKNTFDKKRNINYIKAKFRQILNMNGRLVLELKTKQNITIGAVNVDVAMLDILAYCTFYYYVYNIKYTDHIINKLRADNPLGYDNVNNYTIMMKKFLASVAVGYDIQEKRTLHPFDAIGYIVVTEDCDVFGYPISDRDHFEECLYQNTMFDTPSSKPDKFGRFKRDDTRYYIDICPQIRFKKPKSKKPDFDNLIYNLILN